MISFSFTVYTVPMAQPRQRHRIVKTQGREFVMNYTPKVDPVQGYKYIVRETALEKMTGQPLIDGPIYLGLEFYLPRPKKYDHRKYFAGALPHTGKKDLDNLYKSVADALTGIVYRDDGQVQTAVITKWFHEKDGRPRVKLTVKEVSDDLEKSARQSALR